MVKVRLSIIHRDDDWTIERELQVVPRIGETIYTEDKESPGWANAGIGIVVVDVEHHIDDGEIWLECRPHAHSSINTG